MDDLGALVIWETAAYRAEDAAANRAWRLDSDGTFRERRNRAGAVRPEGADLFWYEEDFGPPVPKRLDAAQLEQVREYLATLEHLPSRIDRRTAGLEGGSRWRVTFGLSSGPRVVEVDSPDGRLVEDLLRPLLAVLEGTA